MVKGVVAQLLLSTVVIVYSQGNGNGETHENENSCELISNRCLQILEFSTLDHVMTSNDKLTYVVTSSYF